MPTRSSAHLLKLSASNIKGGPILGNNQLERVVNNFCENNLLYDEHISKINVFSAELGVQGCAMYIFGNHRYRKS